MKGKFEYHIKKGKNYKKVPSKDIADIYYEYIGRSLRVAEKIVKTNGKKVKIYITSDIKKIPDQGKNVVAIVVSEEVGRTPMYSSEIGLTLKCYGTIPDWEPNRVSLDYIEISRFARTLRNFILSFPYLVWHFAGYFKNMNNIYSIPIGYTGKWKEGDKKRADKREIDVFFAGTIGNIDESGRKIRNLIKPPKVVSRSMMKREVKRLENRGIKAYVNISSYEEGKPLNRKKYINKMRKSKICLSPRGNNVETWRLFEAAKNGCVVISEQLPDRWYYQECPVVQVKDWKNVENKIVDILENESKLLELQKKTEKWYREKCSASSLGKFIADKISNVVM